MMHVASAAVTHKDQHYHTVPSQTKVLYSVLVDKSIPCDLNYSTHTLSHSISLNGCGRAAGA